jgi:3-oxoacyl-[acyl-carrier protein] reductase
MDLGLRDRVALVTGAARGIGAAIARTLADEGCALALIDRERDDAIDMLAASLRRTASAVHVLDADVRDWRAADEVIATVAHTLGRLDIVVCNAGITRDAISWKVSEQDWDDVIDVNLKGCFNYCRAAAPVLRARGAGRIVNISSINGLRGKVGQANYAASKAGIIGLSRTLARELGRDGVTVNVVAPGLVARRSRGTCPSRSWAPPAPRPWSAGFARPEDVATPSRSSAPTAPATSRAPSYAWTADSTCEGEAVMLHLTTTDGIARSSWTRRRSTSSRATCSPHCAHA